MQPFGAERGPPGVPQLHAPQLAKAGADHHDHPLRAGLDPGVLQCLTDGPAEQARRAHRLHLAGDLVGRALLEQARLEVRQRPEAAGAATKGLEELDAALADAGDHAGAGDDEVAHGRASLSRPA